MNTLDICSRALDTIKGTKGSPQPLEYHPTGPTRGSSGIDLRDLMPGIDVAKLWQHTEANSLMRERSPTSPSKSLGNHKRQSSGKKPASQQHSRRRALSQSYDDRRTHEDHILRHPPATTAVVPTAAQPKETPPLPLQSIIPVSEQVAASFKDDVSLSAASSPAELYAALQRTRLQRNKVMRMLCHQRSQVDGCYNKWMDSEKRQQETLLRMVAQSSMLQEANVALRRLRTDRTLAETAAGESTGERVTDQKTTSLARRCAALSAELEETKSSHQSLSQALIELSVSFNERLRMYHQRRACVHCEHHGDPSENDMWKEKFEAAFAALQRNNEHVFRLQNQLREREKPPET